MRICNPIGAVKHARLREVMGLRPGANVLDIGAGKGTLLLDVMERYGAVGTAVEPARMFADEIEREAHRRNLSRGLTLVRAKAADYLSAGSVGPFDAACCVGSTHAFGDIHACVRGLKSLVKPGGVVVWGEGYWKRPPSAEYLAALGASESDYVTHAGNIELLVGAGLTPVWAATASDDEWDEYEWAYARNIENFVRDNSGDPDGAAFLARSRGWRDIVAKWGRETLGFGVYVARVG